MKTQKIPAEKVRELLQFLDRTDHDDIVARMIEEDIPLRIALLRQIKGR